jgi:hypothetical protein
MKDRLLHRPPKHTARACAVCGEPLKLYQGLANAHAVVCTHKCAGAWNRRHNVNYAWAGRK